MANFNTEKRENLTHDFSVIKLSRKTFKIVNAYSVYTVHLSYTIEIYLKEIELWNNQKYFENWIVHAI